VLDVETRAIKGPHVYDSSGMPFHRDERAVVKERIRLDKANANVLRNEITTIDNALTRRGRSPAAIVAIAITGGVSTPVWPTTSMSSSQGGLLHERGRLAHAVRKDQNPPDLRYFDQR